MMTEGLLNWIRQITRDNDLHQFYTSPIWRSTQAHVLKQNHYECSRCKAKGMVVKARVVHHKKYLRQHPELALDEDNLEPLCEKCHYDEHHRKKPGFINKERW